MRYVIRAVKYFFYFCILLAILIGILILVHATEANNVESLFKDGYDSLLKIAIMFGCISAIYPLFGFQKKEAIVPGEYKEIRTAVIEFMESRGYRLESEQGEDMTFVCRSPVTRLFRMFEDRITLTRCISGYEVEGLRKDVVRLVHGLEQRMRYLDR